MPFPLKFPPSQETFSITTNNEAVEVVPNPKTNRLTFKFPVSAVGQYAFIGTEGNPLAAADLETMDTDRFFQVTVGIGTSRFTNSIFVQVTAGAPADIIVIAEE